MLAGTDNDDSVTQNGSGTPFDVFVKAAAASVSRIQCDIGSFANCLAINTDGSLGAALAPGFDFSGYALIPGVLHAYKANATDLAGYQVPNKRPSR